MIRRSKRTFITGLFLLGLLAIAGFLLFALVHRNEPVLLGADAKDHHGFQLLNPFRDRSPERPATVFLEQLRGGGCTSYLANLETSDKRRTSICDKEREYPIVNWSLEAEGKDGGRVLLRYSVIRNYGSKTTDAPFWVWLSPKQDGTWAVSGYEPWY